MAYVLNTEIDDEEIELELTFDPATTDDEIRVRKDPDGHIRVGYIAHDDSYSQDYWGDNADGYEFEEFRTQDQRDVWIASKEAEGKAALIVDNYRHGNDHYSLHKTRSYPDERWDVAPRAAIVLDEHTQNAWNEALAHAGREAAFAAVKEDVNVTLDEYSKWVNGEVYGHVIETFTRAADGEWEIDEAARDDCWGYIGYDYALERLAEEMEDGPVADSVEP